MPLTLPEKPCGETEDQEKQRGSNRREKAQHCPLVVVKPGEAQYLGVWAEGPTEGSR